MKQLKIFIALLFITTFSANIFAFDKGWYLDARAEVGASATLPSISKGDLNKLGGANKLEGLVGFVAGGVLEIGYVFDSPTYFKQKNQKIFGGMSASGIIGISQGFSGQISGSEVNGQQVDVYVNVYYTPVITIAAATKAYFFNNRFSVGLCAGAKVIADPAPTYEMNTSSDDSSLKDNFTGVGTIIVTDWMIKNMNPAMAAMKLNLDYYVPILPTTELILGGYVGFNIYSPKYITMPDSVMKQLKTQNESNRVAFDPTKDPLKSYYINSFDFGVTAGVGFRL